MFRPNLHFVALLIIWCVVFGCLERSIGVRTKIPSVCSSLWSITAYLHFRLVLPRVKRLSLRVAALDLVETFGLEPAPPTEKRNG